MDIIAHGLWAAAGATVARKSAYARIRLGWTVFWAMFPDLLAFAPPVAIGLWLLVTGGSLRRGRLPHVNFAVPLYPVGHSLIVFLLVFGVASVLARRVILELLGWLSHILIDISRTASDITPRVSSGRSRTSASTASPGGRRGSGALPTSPSPLCISFSGERAGSPARARPPDRSRRNVCPNQSRDRQGKIAGD